MIDAADFRMVELMTRADFAAHPVWADFHEERDRTRILGWGVALERLDAEIERYDYCGRSPLYPVLELAAAEELANPSVALVFSTSGGLDLPGYRLGKYAFGVFAGESEFCLNPTLPSRAHTELAKLAQALGCEVSALEPLCYAAPHEWEARLESAGLGPVRGTLDLGEPAAREFQLRNS